MSRCSKTVLACGLVCLASVTIWAEPTIEQWGRFELALNGPTNGNPFVDVKFSARFWQRQFDVEANGFYDGDGIYRVRFMPDKPGEWHYLTVSSSPELNGQTGEFTVTDRRREITARSAWPTLIILPTPTARLTRNLAPLATSGSCNPKRCRSRR